MARKTASHRLAGLVMLAAGLGWMNGAYAGGTVRAAPPEAQAAPAPVVVTPAPVLVALRCGPGYVCDSEHLHVRNSSAQCVRNSEWTPALAEPGCDPLPVIVPHP